LVEPGLFHAGEVPTHLPEEGWFALRTTEARGTTALLPATVQTRRAVDPLLDSGGERGGIDVSVGVESDIPGETVLALRGLPLSPGSVSGIWTRVPLRHPGQFADLPETDSTSRLEVTDADGTKDPDMADRHAGIEIVLQAERAGQVKLQSLAHLPQPAGDGGLYLLWAGDLDGDQQVDLLLGLDTAAGRSSTVLLLSSIALEGDLVGVAAVLDTTGC
jgi:hypothetical protein